MSANANGGGTTSVWWLTTDANNPTIVVEAAVAADAVDALELVSKPLAQDAGDEEACDDGS